MIHYFLVIITSAAVTSVGPFHGLLACEKAATMARIAAIEAKRKYIGTACVSQKAQDFKYKDPK